jgi:hypothetical protein
MTRDEMTGDEMTGDEITLFTIVMKYWFRAWKINFFFIEVRDEVQLSIVEKVIFTDNFFCN